MKTTYHIIPILVYIPKTENPLDEIAVMDTLRASLPEAAILASEDFNNGEVTLEEEDEFSARISDVCPKF